MRASDSEQTAAAGQNEVKARFERIGWGPVDNPYHDLGTDLYLAVRDERLHDRLLVVGAQVKTGDSWFRSPKQVEGTLVGWWFYESDKRHFDDWAAHALPHLVILHDLEASTSYWVHVTPDRIVDTGQGCKILVPVEQTIDPEHRVALLEVAATSRTPRSIEGTAWTGLSTVPPGRLWRHALLAPRLVAPHRNRGFSEPISAVEAAALIALGRLRDLSLFAERHESVLIEKAAVESVDPDWRLVEGLRLGLTMDDPSGLEEWLEDPRGKPQEAAATVALAATLVELERHDDAITVLRRVIDDIEQNPIDHGWVSIQRARARAEVGQLTDARTDADVAIRDTLGAEDDVTASAIASSATWLLFSTAERSDGSLADTLTKTDTAVSWWRSQSVSHALSEHFDRFFSNWVADTSTRFVMEDTLTNGIAAAMTSGALLGDQATWRSYSSLLGRHLVIDAHSQQQEDRLIQALDLLRRSGDDKALKQVAARLLDVGPLIPLARATSNISLGAWTHTTAAANLRLWEQVGDLLDSDGADRAVTVCLDLISDAAHPLVLRATPRFRLPLAGLSALRGLLPAASHDAHSRVATALLPLAGMPNMDELLAGALRDVVRWVRWDQVSDDGQSQWFLAASTASDRRLGPAIASVLAQHDHAAALKQVRDSVGRGDIGSLLAYNGIGILNATSAASAMATVAPRIMQIVADARSNKWSVYEWSAPEVGTAISLHFPEQARWEELLVLLFEPRVAEAEKAAVCNRLVERGALVPDAVRRELEGNLDAVRVAASDFLRASHGLNGLVDRMALSLGLLDTQTSASMLARGVTSPDEGIRRQMALMLADASVAPDEGTGALVGLANDASFGVRRAAASATSDRVRTGDASPLLVTLLAHFLTHPGRTLPLVSARNLRKDHAPDDAVLALVSPLQTHPSALVKQAAGYVVNPGTR